MLSVGREFPLILTAHSVFEKIKMHIRSGFTLSLVHNCATKREVAWINNLLDLDSELNLAEKKVQEYEDELNKFENKKNELLSNGTSTKGWNCRATTRTIDQNNVLQVEMSMFTVHNNLRSLIEKMRDQQG